LDEELVQDKCGGRKVGMTSSQHGSYTLGHTRATMGSNNGSLSGNAELIPSNLPPVQTEVCNSTSRSRNR